MGEKIGPSEVHSGGVDKNWNLVRKEAFRVHFFYIGYTPKLPLYFKLFRLPAHLRLLIELIVDLIIVLGLY